MVDAPSGLLLLVLIGVAAGSYGTFADVPDGVGDGGVSVLFLVSLFRPMTTILAVDDF